MALTAAEKKQIEDSYNRAKARYDAEKSLKLKTASENLALEKSQIGQLSEEQKKQATQTASSAYVSTQQANRVLPSQLAQSGLAQSGYRSLAQQKMAQDLTKNRQGIEQNRDSALQGYARNQASNQLNYDQTVRSTNTGYSQDMADLNLDRAQRLSGTTTTQTNGLSYNDVVLAGNTGRYTYDQYKTALDAFKLDAATKAALLQNYLKYAAVRGIQ